MKSIPLVILSVALLLNACVAFPISPKMAPTRDPLVLGQEVYSRFCAQCHGENAEGHAYPAAPALDDSEHAWHHPDVHLIEWINQGKIGFAQMPAYGDQLTADEVDALIVFIKSLWLDEHRSFQERINQRYPTPSS